MKLMVAVAGLFCVIGSTSAGLRSTLVVMKSVICGNDLFYFQNDMQVHSQSIHPNSKFYSFKINDPEWYVLYEWKEKYVQVVDYEQ